MNLDETDPPVQGLGHNLDVHASTLEALNPSSYQDSLSIEDFLAQTPIGATTNLKPVGGQKAPAENAASFNQLCQQYKLQPHFEFNETTPQFFSAKVQFGEHVFESDEPLPSKKLAKEAICKRGLDLLQSLPESKKRELSSAAQQPLPTSAELHSEENYVGHVNEWCQKKALPTPHFQEYEANCREAQVNGLCQAGRMYAVALTVPSVPHIFGGEKALFPSKQVARRHAAKEAVIFLRGNGLLEASPNQESSKPFSSPQETASAAAQVVDLALSLGFSQPQYNFTPSSPPPKAIVNNPSAFVTATATFLSQDVSRCPRLQGNLCEVSNVFGKKRAKEDCARKVLALLQDIRETRLNETKAAGNRH
ncbi:hypothetical protein K431DRAFT_225919 [Polychaeton citri CBS 116435]|uniref:DRBM domain-containing protein n=1 Tax=Polychaeton citri CBS 116435 TaxID=1314669 RepID=A0A9P4UM00_9PEZI|nr:hypothetical protein K431DRAFT_225919 [Polychaeton citri CBS 116435]